MYGICYTYLVSGDRVLRIRWCRALYMTLGRGEVPPGWSEYITIMHANLFEHPGYVVMKEILHLRCTRHGIAYTIAHRLG